MNGQPMTGLQLGLVSCRSCGLLSKAQSVSQPGCCPRCGEALAFRLHHSVQQTWALLITAAICYVPANLMPVMSTTTPTYAEQDTIMQGIVLLYESGSWPLALIVLIASVIIPLAKIMGLSYLLITVHLRSAARQRERSRLYNLIRFVGRWSMIDVFVVTFTVSLVQLKPLMAVEPRSGVLFFATVVVLTMFAAETFDPRLIWDSNPHGKERHDRT